MSDTGLSICVVGGGPRGTVVLERICANVEVMAPGAGVTVHVVDPYSPGAGRVWRHRQSDLLVMNTVACEVTVFTDPTVQCEGPIQPGPSLYEWARMVDSGEVAADKPTVTESSRM